MSLRQRGSSYLADQLRQARVQLFILQCVSAEDGLDLGRRVSFATESHHPQRGGHHHRRNSNVLNIFVLCHLVVKAAWERHRDCVTVRIAFCTSMHQSLKFEPECQIGAVVSQFGGVAAQLFVLRRDGEGQQTQTDNVCHPHPVFLRGQRWKPVEAPQRQFHLSQMCIANAYKRKSLLVKKSC